MITFESIKWKNFLSTGDLWTEIQLNESNSTLIVGTNGAGKSTLLDALCFALFNKPFRKINRSQLINSINEKGLKVEVNFSIGKDHIPIELIYGDNDWSNNAERNETKNLLGLHNFKIIKNCGHFSFLEKPDQVAKILLK